MDTLITAGAILAAIAIKGVFFYLFTKHYGKSAPKKTIPFNVIQRATEPSEGALRVLVTGGCGFLGSSIVRQLHERLSSRVAITVIDIAVHDKFGPLLPSVTYYQGDICTHSHVLAAVADCSCVVHNAALVGDCLTDDATVQRIIEQGTYNIIEACLERSVRALVYTSSASIRFSMAAVKHGGSQEPSLEAGAPLPAADLNGAYARAKAAAERRVLAANSHVLKAVVLRPGGVYGEKDPYLISNILTGKPYVGPGNVHVPFVWVEDAARAHVDAVEKLLFPTPDTPRIQGRAYHLCHDPVRDPFMYKEFTGGPLESCTKHETVRAAEAAAGVEEPPKGINAYGMPCNASTPGWLVVFLSHINAWVGRMLGVVLLDRSLTPSNMVYAMNHWPCDVRDARSVLGWEPTPWRVVARRLGQQAASASAGGGKAKMA